MRDEFRCLSKDDCSEMQKVSCQMAVGIRYFKDFIYGLCLVDPGSLFSIF